VWPAVGWSFDPSPNSGREDSVFIFIGFVVIFGSLLTGYLMHGGNVMVLLQVGEFIIIGGAGIGVVLVAERPRVVKGVFVKTLGLFKASPYSKQAYQDLLKVLYDLFYVARKDGLPGVEPHVEDPKSSQIFQSYPSFANNHHAVDFLCDTLKVLLTGAVKDHHLAEVLDLDMETHHEEIKQVPDAIRNAGDAMPAFGIVAAVLGVIITMGKIGGAPELVGKSVAAALVGTFLGIFLGYGVFGPIARALFTRVREEEQYMGCIRTALLSFARGDPPISSVEFARRNIEPEMRPTFAEIEEITRRRPEATKAKAEVA
jgi:chemotaxis protein MotA